MQVAQSGPRAAGPRSGSVTLGRRSALFNHNNVPRKNDLHRFSAQRTNAVEPKLQEPSPALVSVDPESPGFVEATICRPYHYTHHEKEVFEELVASMKNCRTALAAVAATTVGMTLLQAGEYEGEAAAHVLSGGLTIGDVASWVDCLLIASLIGYSVEPFEKVLSSRENQMARTFQGVNRLGLIFQQLSIGSIAVSTVTALEAAAKYPPLVVGASALFFGVASLRSAAMWYTLARHTSSDAEVARTLDALRHPNSRAAAELPLLDKWALTLAFGVLLQYEDRPRPEPAGAPAAAAPAAPAQQHSSGNGTEVRELYEFCNTEERMLARLTDAVQTAGLALATQSFVTLMLAVADAGVSDYPEVVSNGITATNKGLTSLLLFSAAASFDRALHTAGAEDVAHLVDGMGKKGLTGLFEALAVLSWAVTIASLVGAALPLMEENVLAKAVGDGLSHRGAEALIEGLQYLTAIIKGV